jgi:site-specific DNA-methyltransferase (adenine-specific)
MEEQKFKNVRLIHGDCLSIMPLLVQEGIRVDAIITDPPYGTTACRWDAIIPFQPMWANINQLIKADGAVCLFGQEPFSSSLRMSNIKNYKYDWIWQKPQGSNFLNCKKQPLKNYEIVSVFSSKVYYPQMTAGKPYVSGKGTSGDTTGNVQKIQTHNIGIRYPTSIQFFKMDKRNSLHPTQKPVELLEYLVKTYTQPGETVLDFTAGVFSTAIACIRTGRKCICIEQDRKYFDAGYERIEQETKRNFS